MTDSLVDALRAVALGAYDFLAKPFRLEELKAAVNRALDELAGNGKSDEPTVIASLI